MLAGMKTETLLDKLESIECKRDEKARRVSNVAPDTVANITAEELESGVTLERLESLNVPVFRYSTQLTVHGKLPDFNPEARPGGYKAIFQNQNGSVGVKFSAIDAEKKSILARCARASKRWAAYSNSTGFELQKSFYVTSETEWNAQRSATVAELRAFPAELIYGTLGAFSLAYGLGYAVAANVGAIPAANVWPLCSILFQIDSPEKLADLERAEADKQAAQRAEWEREHRERIEAEKAEFARFLSTVTLPKLARVELKPGAFVRYAAGYKNGQSYTPFAYKVFYKGGTLGATINGGKFAPMDQKRVDKLNKAAERGEIFGESQPAESTATPDEKQPHALKNPTAEASPRQTFALFCATGKDWRKAGLTMEQASRAIEAAKPFRKNKAGALAAIVKLLGKTP